MTDSDTTTSTFSTGGLGRKLVEPIIRAVRAEITAARKEIADRAKSARTGIVLVAAGALLAIITVMLFAGLGVALLALVVPVWAATLITLGVFGVIGAILIAVGVRALRRGLPPVPSDTIAHAKQQLSSAAHHG